MNTTETSNQGFEWTLKFRGQNISERSTAAFEACHEFHLWKDYILKIVGYEEFQQLVTDGKIAPPESYWTIEPGQHGLVCKTFYAQDTRGWDNMRTCYHDFERGWNACEKRYQKLADWDAAIAHEKVRKAWYKSARRVASISLRTGYNQWSLGQVAERIELLPEVTDLQCLHDRVELKLQCTGPRLIELLYDIQSYYSWILVPEIVADPTKYDQEKKFTDPILQMHDMKKRKKV